MINKIEELKDFVLPEEASIINKNIAKTKT